MSESIADKLSRYLGKSHNLIVKKSCEIIKQDVFTDNELEILSEKAEDYMVRQTAKRILLKRMRGKK